MYWWAHEKRQGLGRNLCSSFMFKEHIWPRVTEHSRQGELSSWLTILCPWQHQCCTRLMCGIAMVEGMHTLYEDINMDLSYQGLLSQCCPHIYNKGGSRPRAESPTQHHFSWRQPSLLWMAISLRGLRFYCWKLWSMCQTILLLIPCVAPITEFFRGAGSMAGIFSMTPLPLYHVVQAGPHCAHERKCNAANTAPPVDARALQQWSNSFKCTHITK